MSSRMINECIPVACGLVAGDGRLLDCNAAFAALLRQDRETLLRQRWDERLFGTAVVTALTEGQAEAVLPAGAFGRPGPESFNLSLRAVRLLAGVPRVLVLAELALPEPSAPAAHAAVLRQALADSLATQIELLERNRHLDAVLESTPDMIFIHDWTGRLVEINDKVPARFGFSRQQLLAMGDFTGVVGEAGGIARQRLEAALRGELQDFEEMARTAAGDRFPVEVSLRGLQGESGAVVATVRDVGPRKEAEARLAAAEGRFRAVVEQTLVGILIVQEGVIRYANPGLAQMFGFAAAEDLIEQVASLDLVAPADRNRMSEQLRRIANGSEGPLCRFTGQRQDGVTFQVEMHGRRFDYAGGPAVIGVLVDVSERCRFEEELERRASYDGLTGLPNRTLLFDRLNQAIAHARRRDELFAFLFLDLDGFKAVNDSGGHEAGDQVLRIVAERFSAVLRASDTLARLGGDEFAVIAPELLFRDDVESVARKLCDTLQSPIVFGGVEYTVGVSIGIALFPAAADDANGLYRAADTAMYVAKEEDRGGYRFAPAASAPASSPA